MAELILLTPPGTEPVELDEALEFAHISSLQADSETRLSQLLKTAREMVENHTGLALIEQQWRMVYDRFPSCGFFRLPKPPLKQVDSVNYLDTANAAQVVNPSRYDWDSRRPARVYLTSPSDYWPATSVLPDAVWIDFTSCFIKESDGTSAPDLIPESIKYAIKAMFLHLYENREPVLVGGSADAVRAQELPRHVAQILANETIPHFQWET